MNNDKPWENEPDREHWVDEATDLDCLIIRNSSGALCGYVGVPEGHPSFGKYYEDVHAEVHGGLTYSDACDGHICHSRDKGDEPANEHVWWLGFDCAHGYDLIPMMTSEFLARGATYKDIEYVKRECRHLAAQLKELAS